MPLSNIKILIIEDQLITALDLKFKLKDMGYNVIGVARNEDGVIKILKDETPDVALLDINLSRGKSGIEIAPDLIKSNIKVFFITAQSDPYTRDKINKMKMQIFYKPLNVERIKTEIDKAFNITPFDSN